MPPPLHLLLLLILLPTSSSTPLNITLILSRFPAFSTFNSLLSSTSIPSELSSRSSLTLLAVPNSHLHLPPNLSPSSLADLLRYHVLLQYLSPSDLLLLPPSGHLFTTLFQTTGRAPSNLGSLNLSFSPSTHSISAFLPLPFSPSNATLLSSVDNIPYNLSIFSLSSLLLPFPDLLAASQSRPPPLTNITRVLLDARDFNVAASMLQASGVAAQFESDERGAGVTMFVPTDEAFADLPVTERLQSFPADRKSVVLQYHVLHSYYPLGSLESIVNPVQPTLATEGSGAGRFTLNITRVNGSVAIDTGVVQATITRTVFDQNPVAVFAVSHVLLPREFFGRDGGVGNATPETMAPPPVDMEAMAPEGAEGGQSSPTRVSSPPGLRDAIRSGGSAANSGGGGGRSGFAWVCTAAALFVLIVGL